MEKSRKRSFDEANQEHGVAATLGRIKADTGITAKHEEEWTMVQRSSKKRKHVQKQRAKAKQEKASGHQEHGGQGDSKPALIFVPSHKLKSNVKVSDLQNLVLYCLADGAAPQWIAVQNHMHVQKAVMLMAPGLERAMFTGQIPLEQELAADAPETSNGEYGNEKVKLATVVPSASSSSATTTSKNPDDFLPLSLSTDSLPSPLKPLASIFTQIWPIKAPGDDKYSKLHSSLHAMLTSPISQSQESKAMKGVRPPKGASSWVDERTPVTTFITSKEDLLANDFIPHPLHFKAEKSSEYSQLREASNSLEANGWCDMRFPDPTACEAPDSEVEEGSLTAGRMVLAIDCEMCIVNGGEYALTRVSIVNWAGEVVLDEFVLPDKPIKDYLTALVPTRPGGSNTKNKTYVLRFSGVSAKSLENVNTSLNDIQQRLLGLLHPRTVLVGHSLDSDLKALKITHPFIVDTSILYPHPRGPPLKSSLKWLAQKYLSREIQKGHGSGGHDSVEDARASMDLVKQKCEKGLKWGACESSGEPIFKRLLRTPKPHVSGVTGQPRAGRTGAMVDCGPSEKSFGATASFSIGCNSDAEVLAGVRRAVLGDDDGIQIPSGGVDFTFARFNELFSLRGWNYHQRRSRDSAHASTPTQGEGTLSAAVTNVVNHIAAVREMLPPCTLFIVFSGSGDPCDLLRLQEQQRTFKKEYTFKKWDELSVKWTDVEDQALRAACKRARDGIGFMCIT